MKAVAYQIKCRFEKGVVLRFFSSIRGGTGLVKSTLLGSSFKKDGCALGGGELGGGGGTYLSKGLLAFLSVVGVIDPSTADSMEKRIPRNDE